MLVYSKYSDKDIKSILSSLVITVDTREQANKHITDYFDSKKIKWESEKMDTGDYSVKMPQDYEQGIIKDTHMKVLVERKNSIDELASSIKAERFEHELIRSQDSRFVLLVEDTIENLISGNYRSEYSSNALMARLKSFEARYGFNTVFIGKQSSGEYIHKHMYYFARAWLKGYLKEV